MILAYNLELCTSLGQSCWSQTLGLSCAADYSRHNPPWKEPIMFCLAGNDGHILCCLAMLACCVSLIRLCSTSGDSECLLLSVTSQH